ncbi:hypothetical protein HDU76_010630 [Blyttiomyces sp. JEL0837]|nr:hypothetical protein HDU76_010630 [Blyttiomyces sp. JEL0837]
MFAIAEFCVIPIGVGASVSKEVAICQKIIKSSGLKYEMHANGTNIEGEWDDIMNVIKRCQIAVHEAGAPRISTSIKIGTRTDKASSMEDKVKVVNEILAAGDKKSE